MNSFLPSRGWGGADTEDPLSVSQRHGCRRLVVHVHARWNEVGSDLSSSLEGIAGVLYAMMGGSKQCPRIIARRLCHISHT